MSIVEGIKLLFVNDRDFALQLYRIIRFIPRDIDFYKIPFIHKASSIPHKNALVNNERLEYLGDAILSAVIAHFLFEYYHNRNEGFLSQTRSKIVNRQQLNSIGLKLGLMELADQFIINNQPGKYFYGDILEALIGAIFLDKGFQHARKFILKQIIDQHINLNELEYSENDYKSRLIEWAQKNKKDIKFECREQTEDSTSFFICYVYQSEEVIGQGNGCSKKEAEQNAAELATKNLGLKFYENT